MPKDLGDVLHYFLPEAGAPGEAETRAAPVIAVALGEADLVRAALLWNLAVELARQGARVSVVTPRPEPGAGAGPAPGRGPLGVEMIWTQSGEVAELGHLAERAALRPHHGDRPALVLAGVPAPWLGKGADAAPLLDWVVLLVRGDERDRRDAFATIEQVAAQAPEARLGASVYGVRRIAEARHTFERLAAAVESRLGRALTSYGLLVDDVHLSRPIVTGRPISLSQPGAPAARALADVARLVLEDAGSAGALRG